VRLVPSLFLVAVVTTLDIHLSSFRSCVTLYGEHTRTEEVIQVLVRLFYGYRSAFVRRRLVKGKELTPEVDKGHRREQTKPCYQRTAAFRLIHRECDIVATSKKNISSPRIKKEETERTSVLRRLLLHPVFQDI